MIEKKITTICELCGDEREAPQIDNTCQCYGLNDGICGGKLKNKVWLSADDLQKEIEIRIKKSDDARDLISLNTYIYSLCESSDKKERLFDKSSSVKELKKCTCKYPEPNDFNGCNYCGGIL